MEPTCSMIEHNADSSQHNTDNQCTYIRIVEQLHEPVACHGNTFLQAQVPIMQVDPSVIEEQKHGLFFMAQGVGEEEFEKCKDTYGCKERKCHTKN